MSAITRPALHHLLQLAVVVVGAAPAAGSRRRPADRLRLRRQSSARPHRQAARRMLGEGSAAGISWRISRQGDGVGGHLHAVSATSVLQASGYPPRRPRSRPCTGGSRRTARAPCASTARARRPRRARRARSNGRPLGTETGSLSILRASTGASGRVAGLKRHAGPLDSITMASPAMASKRQTSVARAALDAFLSGVEVCGARSAAP